MIDLTEIPSEGGFTFERFVEDLLRALGWIIILGAGKGPDGGRDIIASQSERTATGREWQRRVVVQCKHYAGSGNSIKPKDIAEFQLMPKKHDCEGWLLVTSTQLSSDATLNVEAARKTNPGLEFDYWDAERIREHLLRDECRKILTQYLPGNYARCANILIPQPAEIREVVSSWLSAAEDRTQRFSIDLDSDESLLSWAISKNHTLRDLRETLSDEFLVSEFLTTWNSTLARGNEKAPSLLLMHGLRRLRQMCQKGLPKDARDRLLCAELSTNILHREMKRRYLRFLMVAEGCPQDWTALAAPAGLPPVELFGAVFIIYCKDPDQSAAGAIRVVSEGEPLPFMAGFSVEFKLRVEKQFWHQLCLEYKCDAGSDPVCVACVGYSEHPGRWTEYA